MREEVKKAMDKVIEEYDPVLKKLAESEKLRWRNFPLFLIEGVIRVSGLGENKYGTYDFLEKEYTVNDHLDALKRHLLRFEDPNQSDYDHESKELHLYHVAWRAMVAGFVMKFKPDLDDRWKG